MTIIAGIEIDNIQYIPNNLKNAIKNNSPVEDKLHMIICISNPCQYARRYILAREFIQRIEKDETNVILYVVELAYHLPNQAPQKFYVTNPDNKRHLQITTKNPPLWVKENLLNIGVKTLLPSDWKAVAFCDADIEFDNPNFAIDTLKVLNGTRDIVQMHSHCVDMDIKLDPMNIFNSFGFQYTNKRRYTSYNKNILMHYFHPGFNVAMTRKTYEQLGGLYEFGILGSGDNHLFLSVVQNGIKSVNVNTSQGYKNSILEYQERCKGLKLGYVPGVIKHYFHGAKKNRKYAERWQILVKHQYDPFLHLQVDDNGLFTPSKHCPKELLDDIFNYFVERNEDEGVLEAIGEKSTKNPETQAVSENEIKCNYKNLFNNLNDVFEPRDISSEKKAGILQRIYNNCVPSLFTKKV